MDSPTRPVSPLRQRMLDDMRMRKLNPKTQSAYIRAVCRFTRYLGRSPDTATVDDLRNYQLQLVDTGTSPMSLNAAISGLKFFFDTAHLGGVCVHAGACDAADDTLVAVDIDDVHLGALLVTELAE